MSTSECTTSPKRCNVCQKEFPSTSEFWHVRKASKDGLAYTCKSCVVNRTKKWVEDDPERAKKTASESYVRNKPKRQAYNKAHIDHRGEQKRSPAYKAKESARRKQKATELRDYNRQYAANHPGWHNEIMRNWRKTNPEKAKAIIHRRIAAKHNAGGSYTAEDIKNLYAEQDGMCAYCGIRIYMDIPRDVHVDHIRPLARSGSNAPDNLLLSCQSCNQSKGAKLLTEWQAVRGW